MTNRVNYCNAVLYGTSTAVIRRTQMLLNDAARMVVDRGKYEHITPVLCDTLHWVPVTARIQFKLAALTFDCVRDTGPVYLKQVICLVPNLSCRSLRSAGCGDLFVSRANTPSASKVFLADRTNGRAIGTVLRPSVVCAECIVAKRYVLQQKLLLRAYRKSYMRNRLVPK